MTVAERQFDPDDMSTAHVGRYMIVGGSLSGNYVDILNNRTTFSHVDEVDEVEEKYKEVLLGRLYNGVMHNFRVFSPKEFELPQVTHEYLRLVDSGLGRNAKVYRVGAERHAFFKERS